MHKLGCLELTRFQALCSLQNEIAKKFCRYQISEEGTRLNAGYALAQLLDKPYGDDEAVSRLTIKCVFAVCRDNYCSINGAPIGTLVDENMRKERAVLAQVDTKTQLPLADRNGKPGKSDCVDVQVVKIKKELTFAQKVSAKLENKLPGNKPSVVPRARKKIPRMMQLGASCPINRRSKPRHRNRDLHL